MQPLAKQVQAKLLPIQDYVTQEVYDFIAGCIIDEGMPPTYREIGAHCLMSHIQARRHVLRLVSLGYLVRNSGTARSLRLVGGDQRQVVRTVEHNRSSMMSAVIAEYLRVRINRSDTDRASLAIDAILRMESTDLAALYHGILRVRHQQESVKALAGSELRQRERSAEESSEDSMLAASFKNAIDQT